MTDKNGVGVTVISHDSESRKLVQGCETQGYYSRDNDYTETSLYQLSSLTRVSTHCEQFIKFECRGSVLLDPLWKDWEYHFTVALGLTRT